MAIINSLRIPCEISDCRYGTMLYLPHDHYVGDSLHTFGEYSESEVEVFRWALAGGHGVALDCGAYIGVHTVALAQLAKQVVAFEPQQLPFQICCANVALNGLGNVEMRWQALGASQETVKVPMMDYASGSMFSSVPLSAAENTEYSYPVEQITLDSLRLPELAFAKLDCEGMEREVLLGARETIARCKPVMYVEADKPPCVDPLLATIRELGYVAFWHLAPYHNLNNWRGEKVPEGNTCSIMLICLPEAKQDYIKGLRRAVEGDGAKYFRQGEQAVVVEFPNEQ